MRRLLLIALALAAAGAAALLTRQAATPPPAPQPVAQPAPAPKLSVQDILVAKTALPPGTILKPDHFAWQAWPEDGVNEAYITRKSGGWETLPGHVVRTAVPAGLPIVTAGLVGPGERGFLAAVLRPGLRAITVPINNISGLAGFLFPGDRVDVLLSHEVDGTYATETVLRNVRVLAVDTRTDNQATQPQAGRTVTLEVRPRVAEKIALAQQLGTLGLTLRSLTGGEEEPEMSERVTYTLDRDVSGLMGGAITEVTADKAGTAGPGGPTVALVRGTRTAIVTFDKED